MNDSWRASDSRYHDALKSIQHAVDKYKSCTEAEKEQLRQDLAQLREMQDKLARGRVEIVLFGEISTGKSALINALVGEEVAEVNVQGGWTRQNRLVPWKEQDYVVPGLDDSELVIVDTPGINEVGDSDHETIAKAAARRGDLILFVTDSDLNETEYSALIALLAVHKPIIVVLNKRDLYTDEDLAQLVRVLREERLKGLVPADNFVCTSADPRRVEYVHVDARGHETSEWRKPRPDVAELKARILEILAQDGLALIALNAAMYAADKTDRIGRLRIQLRDQRATQAIWSFAATKAVAVSLNLIPIADVVGGTAVDIAMVGTLARIYGMEMTWVNSRKLIFSVLKAAGWVTVAELATHTVVAIFKGLTLGASTAISAIPQAAAAGYGSYIVGQAAKYYFENGASWGPEAPKSVVRRILAETDKDSVLQHLKDEITRKIRSNFYSSSPRP
jgi:small GTP-binding protein